MSSNGIQQSLVVVPKLAVRPGNVCEPLLGEVAHARHRSFRTFVKKARIAVTCQTAPFSKHSKCWNRKNLPPSHSESALKDLEL